jgi:hypothetical protein
MATNNATNNSSNPLTSRLDAASTQDLVLMQNLQASTSAAGEIVYQGLNTTPATRTFGYLRFGVTNRTGGSENGNGALGVISGGSLTDIVNWTPSTMTFNLNVATSSLVCTGGSIDGTTIGATTKSTGAFTSATARTDAASKQDLFIAQNLQASTSASGQFAYQGLNSASATRTFGGIWFGIQNRTASSENGIGAISVIQAGTLTDLASWTATTFTVNGNLATSALAVTGGSIDGTTIGASTKSTGAFTNLTARTDAGSAQTLLTLQNETVSNSAATKIIFQGNNASSSLTTFSALQFGITSNTGAAESGSFKFTVKNAGADLDLLTGSAANLTVGANLNVNAGQLGANSVALTGGNIDGTVIGLTTRSNAQYLQPTRTITSSTTMLATDCSKFIYFNSATAITITLPQQSTTVLAAGYGFNYKNLGAGTVTFVIEGSDVFRGNTTAQTNANGTIYLQAIAPQNSWDNYGGTTTLTTLFKVNSDSPTIYSTVPYYFMVSADKSYTFTTIRYQCISGTATVSMYVNGTLTTGGSALSVSSTLNTSTLTANNAVVSGQIVELRVTASSSCVGLTAQIDATYTQ